MFLVDRDLPGVSIKRVPRYTHTFVYEHPEFVFADVRVGPECVLGDLGDGYELTRDWFTEERLMIGARTIGAAHRALTLAADWARERVQGGAASHRASVDPGDARRLRRPRSPPIGP